MIDSVQNLIELGVVVWTMMYIARKFFPAISGRVALALAVGLSLAVGFAARFEVASEYVFPGVLVYFVAFIVFEGVNVVQIVRRLLEKRYEIKMEP